MINYRHTLFISSMSRAIYFAALDWRVSLILCLSVVWPRRPREM